MVERRRPSCLTSLHVGDATTKPALNSEVRAVSALPASRPAAANLASRPSSVPGIPGFQRSQQSVPGIPGLQRLSRSGHFGAERDEEVHRAVEGLRLEVDCCVSRLRENLDVILDRRQQAEPRRASLQPVDQMERIAEQRSVSSLTPALKSGWASAPGDGKNVQQLIVKSLQDIDLDSVCSETPRKLPPPPAPGTPVQHKAPYSIPTGSPDRDRPSSASMEAPMARVSTIKFPEEEDVPEAPLKVANPLKSQSTVAFALPDVADEDDSVSSTRTGSLPSRGSNSFSAVEPFNFPFARNDDEETSSNLTFTEVEPVVIGHSEFDQKPSGSLKQKRPMPKRMTGRWLKQGSPRNSRQGSKTSKVAPSPETPTDTPSERTCFKKTLSPRKPGKLQRIDRWATPKSNTSMTLESSGSVSTPSERSEKNFNFSPIHQDRREVRLFSRARLGYFTRRFTKTQTYELVSALVITLNAMMIIWETDWRATFAAQKGARHGGNYFFFIAAYVFAIVFVLDLILRVCSERMMFFFSREWGWNCFDIFVTFTAVMEAVVQWYMENESMDSEVRIFLRKFSMFRILRLLRVIRVARALKIIRFIRELRMMVFSLTSSLRSLAWSAVLIMIILLVFGVFFTDGVTGYCEHHDLMHAESTQEMRKWFGRVPTATISLFMAMTGGEDWGVILEALEPLPLGYSFIFIGFVSFAVLALLNLVTAVFINTAMQRSQNDRELAVQQELESKEELVKIIEQVFMELDTDRSGTLSIDEFEKHCEDEKIQAYLKSRQIDIGQVRTLFTLLDIDQTGDVSMDEFVQGILRLKGTATSMDVAVLTYQVEYIVQMLSALTGDRNEVSDVITRSMLCKNVRRISQRLCDPMSSTR